MTPHLNAIGVVVADIDAAIAFYGRLGLQFGDTADGHAESQLSGGMKLMLDTEASIQSFTTGWTRPTGSPRVGFAFECASPAEVDATFAELAGAGAKVEREPWDAFWGQRYASVLDPDGNGIDLYAALPGAT